jgi:hypothetical protein
MAEQQVFSEVEVDFGNYGKLFWNWSGNNSIIPKKRTLEINTLTFNYFPSGGGTIGRADVTGRDASGNAVWRIQIVYVEPQKTVHLVFPKGLKLKADGYVELGFVIDGPGKIFLSANGMLLP